MIKSEHIG